MEIKLHAKKALCKGVYLLSPWSNPKTQGKAPQALGGEWGESIPLPSRLETLKERHELPQQGLGQSPSEKGIWCILSVTEPFWLQDIVNI